MDANSSVGVDDNLIEDHVVPSHTNAPKSEQHHIVRGYTINGQYAQHGGDHGYDVTCGWCVGADTNSKRVKLGRIGEEVVSVFH